MPCRPFGFASGFGGSGQVEGPPCQPHAVRPAAVVGVSEQGRFGGDVGDAAESEGFEAEGGLDDADGNSNACSRPNGKTCVTPPGLADFRPPGTPTACYGAGNSASVRPMSR